MSATNGPLQRLTNLLTGTLRSHLAQWSRYVPQIAALEEPLMQQSDFDLKKHSLSLRYRARSGEPLDRLLVEAFALVREAGRRRLNMRHFDVQLLGGAAVHYNSIVEMQTGEGKTLTATLPLYLAALEGKGAHLATDSAPPAHALELRLAEHLDHRNVDVWQGRATRRSRQITVEGGGVAGGRGGGG